MFHQGVFPDHKYTHTYITEIDITVSRAVIPVVQLYIIICCLIIYYLMVALCITQIKIIIKVNGDILL